MMKNLVRKLIVLVSASVLCFSVYKILSIQEEYRKGQEEYRKIAEDTIFPEKKQEEGSAEINQEMKPEAAKGPKVDFETLEKINPDVAGVITMENLGIVYPVVIGTDNTHYLSHTFSGEENAAGAIFINCENSRDFSDGNTIIFGHNMKDGSMFGKLKELRDPETCQANRRFYISLPEGNREYEIFSLHVARSGGEVYQTFPEKGDAYSIYQQNMLAVSELDLGTEITPDDDIVTLSTCIGDGEERFVVQAKWIRE